jgi:thioredoxin reductase (NADPH)
VSVHYAATEAEAQRCEGEEVAVVGGGNSAGQAAVYLAGRTRRVYLLIRGDDLGKSMSRYLVDRIMNAENVELLANTKVGELMGEDRLEGVVVEDNRSGTRRTLSALLRPRSAPTPRRCWLTGAPGSYSRSHRGVVGLRSSQHSSSLLGTFCRSSKLHE